LNKINDDDARHATGLLLGKQKNTAVAAVFME